MRLNRILRCINPGVKPIIHPKMKLCSPCKFYNPDKKTCALFHEIDIVSKKVIPSIAESCRKDETKCGSKAVFYREKTEEDYQKEDDKDFWNDLKWFAVVYCLIIIATNRR